MNAIIHMQPLNVRRQPIPGLATKRCEATIPRDAQPHIVGNFWDLDAAENPEMPYYMQIWADGGKPIIREIDCAGPSKLRFLNSITFWMWLTVLPTPRTH